MDGDTSEEVESEVETDFQDSQCVPCLDLETPINAEEREWMATQVKKSRVRSKQIFKIPLLVPEMNYPPSDLGNDPSYHDDALRLIRVNVHPRVWMTYVSDAKFYDVTRKGSRLTSAQSYNTGLYGVRYSPLHIINSCRHPSSCGHNMHAWTAKL